MRPLLVLGNLNPTGRFGRAGGLISCLRVSKI